MKNPYYVCHLRNVCVCATSQLSNAKYNVKQAPLYFEIETKINVDEHLLDFAAQSNLYKTFDELKES